MLTVEGPTFFSKPGFTTYIIIQPIQGMKQRREKKQGTLEKKTDWEQTNKKAITLLKEFRQ